GRAGDDRHDRSGVVVADRERAGPGGDGGVGGSRQRDRDGLVVFVRGVAEDVDGDGLGGLAGGERERPGAGAEEVLAGGGGQPGGGVVHGHGLAAGGRQRDGQGHMGRVAGLPLGDAGAVDRQGRGGVVVGDGDGA